MDDRGKNMLRPVDVTAEKSFEIVPDAEGRTAIADDLQISAIRKLRFSGSLAPIGKRDFELRAQLGATVVQPCGVTLEPVVTRIDVAVVRIYSPEVMMPEAVEAEMPEDDSIEPLPDIFDLNEIMVEALAIELPPFPRAEGVDAVNLSVTEPGKTPLSEEDLKPFAGLAGLRDKLSDKG